MQTRTSLLSAFTLSTAMALGAAAMAADLPKEGTFNVTYFGFGTSKATAIGMDRLLAPFDQNGLTVGNGILDHMTWHCSGLFDVANGMAQWQNRCVGTDPAGDQIVSDGASDGKYAVDARSFSGTGTFTTGTGKFAGISGGWTGVFHSPEFRTTADGSVAEYGSHKGSYKLP